MAKELEEGELEDGELPEDEPLLNAANDVCLFFIPAITCRPGYTRSFLPKLIQAVRLLCLVWYLHHFCLQGYNSRSKSSVCKQLLTSIYIHLCGTSWLHTAHVPVAKHHSPAICICRRHCNSMQKPYHQRTLARLHPVLQLLQTLTMSLRRQMLLSLLPLIHTLAVCMDIHCLMHPCLHMDQAWCRLPTTHHMHPLR